MHQLKVFGGVFVKLLGSVFDGNHFGIEELRSDLSVYVVSVIYHITLNETCPQRQLLREVRSQGGTRNTQDEDTLLPGQHKSSYQVGIVVLGPSVQLVYDEQLLHGVFLGILGFDKSFDQVQHTLLSPVLERPVFFLGRKLSDLLSIV